MRSGCRRHFDFAGYVLGQHPHAFRPARGAAPEPRYAPTSGSAIVTVGRSGRGHAPDPANPAGLADRPAQDAELRMVWWPGPRSDPLSIGAPAGVEVHASCTIAIAISRMRPRLVQADHDRMGARTGRGASVYSNSR